MMLNNQFPKRTGRNQMSIALPLSLLQTVNKDLQTAPEDLVALTVVMRAVGRVSQDHAHLHTALLDVRQMFHTLQVYGIVVSLLRGACVMCMKGVSGVHEVLVEFREIKRKFDLDFCTCRRKD